MRRSSLVTTAGRGSVTPPPRGPLVPSLPVLQRKGAGRGRPHGRPEHLGWRVEL